MCSVNTQADMPSGARASARAPSRLARRIAVAWLAVVVAFALVPAAYAVPLQRTQFDHRTTGFELIGQHRDLPCEACHFNAVFKGTPRDCAPCHGIGTTVRATAKPANHILSTQRCDACHTPIAWKPAVTFDHTQALGSCSSCHNGVQAQGKGATHIDTNLECDACHSTIGWAGAVFNHANVTGGCARCHNGVQSTGMPPNHIPTNNAPCESCHSTTNFTTFAGTVMGLAAHQAVAAAGVACMTCHETAPYLGMKPSTATTSADSRPSAALDKNHPTTGDCGQCHDTTTFANSALRPANHIPTNAICTQCHTTAGNYALYSVTATHQGVTSCLSCHGPTVAGTFANIKITTTPGNHIPTGNLDCNGSGCHSTANVNAGGFSLGAANINSPTLSVAGHATVATAVPGCQTCHEAANYLGMVVGTGTLAGDSRPSATLDAAHPSTGDCNGCHTTTPTFALHVSGGAKPSNHIPTNAPCAQCHTTAGNYAAYVMGATGHAGITSGCAQCHGPGLTFANMAPPTLKLPPVGTPAHIPYGTAACELCHAANVFTTFAGTIMRHAAVRSMTCMTCHEVNMRNTWYGEPNNWTRPG